MRSLKFLALCTGIILSNLLYATPQETIDDLEQLISKAEMIKAYTKNSGESHMIFDLTLLDLIPSKSLLHPYTATIELEMFSVNCLNVDQPNDCSPPKLYDQGKFSFKVNVGGHRSRVTEVITVIGEGNNQVTLVSKPDNYEVLTDVLSLFNRS